VQGPYPSGGDGGWRHLAPRVFSAGDVGCSCAHGGPGGAVGCELGRRGRAASGGRDMPPAHLRYGAHKSAICVHATRICVCNAALAILVSHTLISVS
jgi:hypothetical protein